MLKRDTETLRRIIAALERELGLSRRAMDPPARRAAELVVDQLGTVRQKIDAAEMHGTDRSDPDEIARLAADLDRARAAAASRAPVQAWLPIAQAVAGHLFRKLTNGGSQDFP